MQNLSLSLARFFFLSLTLFLAFSGHFSTPAHSEEVRVLGTSLCADDSHCDRRVLQFMTSLNPGFPARLELGVRTLWEPNEASPSAALRISDQLLRVANAGGDLTVIPFEAIWLPGGEQLRVRVSLAQSDVTFICGRLDGQGGVGPLASLFAHGTCRPDAVFGMGGEVMGFQMDTFSSHRVALRIAEVRGVLNFLSNGMSQEFFRRQLLASMGVSVDHFVYNKLDPGKSETVARMVLGIQGAWVSQDLKWELRGQAQLRPSFQSLQDLGVDLRTSAAHRFILGDQFLVELGGVGQFSYWSVPARSFGPYASDRLNHSLFLGAQLGISYNPRYAP